LRSLVRELTPPVWLVRKGVTVAQAIEQHIAAPRQKPRREHR
jgi:hypothetical protein